MIELTFRQWTQGKINIIFVNKLIRMIYYMFIVCQIRDKRTQFKEVDLALKIITFNNNSEGAKDHL